MPALSLRPMRRTDLALMSTWLAAPHVSRWWGDDADPAAVERQYGPSLDGADPAQLRIASLAGRPFGFLQWYLLADEPAYATELAPLLEIEPTDASIDYLIGEPNLVGRGLGRALVTAGCDEVWQTSASRRIVVPVHAANTASRRALLGAGFAEVAQGDLEPDFPTDDRRHIIQALRRPDGL
jgi:aminoglycoside 6'-N-acetyltransferase